MSGSCPHCGKEIKLLGIADMAKATGYTTARLRQMALKGEIDAWRTSTGWVFLAAKAGAHKKGWKGKAAMKGDHG